VLDETLKTSWHPQTEALIQTHEMKCHCDEWDPSPVIARLTQSAEAISGLGAQAPQSDLKGLP
jgi:hypothetical protein